MFVTNLFYFLTQSRPFSGRSWRLKDAAMVDKVSECTLLLLVWTFWRGKKFDDLIGKSRYNYRIIIRQPFQLRMPQQCVFACWIILLYGIDMFIHHIICLVLILVVGLPFSAICIDFEICRPSVSIAVHMYVPYSFTKSNCPTISEMFM